MNIGSLFLISLSFHLTLLVQVSQDNIKKMKILNTLYGKKSENFGFPDGQVKNDFQIKLKDANLFSYFQMTNSGVYSLQEYERRFVNFGVKKFKQLKLNSNADAGSMNKFESVGMEFSETNFLDKYYIKDLKMSHLHSNYGSITIPDIKNDDSFKMENLNMDNMGSLSQPRRRYSNWSFDSKYINYSPRVTRRIRQEIVKAKRKRNNLSLWIDEQQVRMFSGYPMEIYVIVEGRVMPYILDPDFESQLPIIPSEVKTVNFTWKSGGKKYFYNFDLLKSFNTNILHPPFVSIRRRGRVPKKSKSFSVHIPCVGNVSDVAAFAIGLSIHNKKGDPLPDTPIQLRLRKKCEITGDPDSACNEKCANGGICNAQKKCQCLEGYMGKLCQTALCYPQCHNGGTCSSPGRCSCLVGYHGRYCEGGICSQKCLNGGKCMQKDTCDCQNGYYGNRCEFSKCIIPCVNNGKCQGVNQCRCKAGYSGNHCEIITVRGLSQLFRRCHLKCRHGECVDHGKCKCDEGFSGRWCKKRISNKKHKHNKKKKLWV